jgi:hypothetical protein
VSGGAGEVGGTGFRTVLKLETMKVEIAKIIAEYLESKTEFKADFVDGKKTSKVYFRNAVCSIEFLAEIAAEIAGKVLAAVEPKPYLDQISVGQKVRIIALLDHGTQDGHCLPIGHIGIVREIDSNDNDLTYRLDNEWVSRGEIIAVL